MTFLKYLENISKEEKQNYPNIFCHDFTHSKNGYWLRGNGYWYRCKNCDYLFFLKNEETYDLRIINSTIMKKQFCDEMIIRKIIQ